jgi:hypothetical protein
MIEPEQPPPRVDKTIWMSAVLFVVGLVLVGGFSAGFVLYEVYESQHQWCTVLTLLTSHPVPKPADPAANPSRQQGWLLYSDFVTVRDRFRC